MLKYKIMFQIFFVPKYFWVLEAVIFGTLLPEHPVYIFLIHYILHYKSLKLQRFCCRKVKGAYCISLKSV